MVFMVIGHWFRSLKPGDLKKSLGMKDGELAILPLGDAILPRGRKLSPS